MGRQMGIGSVANCRPNLCNSASSFYHAIGPKREIPGVWGQSTQEPGKGTKPRGEEGTQATRPSWSRRLHVRPTYFVVNHIIRISLDSGFFRSYDNKKTEY